MIFKQFTTNEIKATGWLRNQLEIQAKGLSGNWCAVPYRTDKSSRPHIGAQESRQYTSLCEPAYPCFQEDRQAEQSRLANKELAPFLTGVRRAGLSA